MNRRRLDAECIRDTILAVSGQLRLEMGGPGFPAGPGRRLRLQGRRQTRRSVYVPVFRNALPELFEVFDFADPSMVVGRRNVSTVAPQALFLMNHPFVARPGPRHAARRLLAEPGPRRSTARVDRAYRLALGRPPTASRDARAGAAGSVARAGDDADAEEAWATRVPGAVRVDRFPLCELTGPLRFEPRSPDRVPPDQPSRPPEECRVRLRLPGPGRAGRRSGRRRGLGQPAGAAAAALRRRGPSG